jgi:hypothetical protein
MGFWNKVKDKSKDAWGKVKEKTKEVTKKVARKIEEAADKMEKWADKITQNKTILTNKVSEEGSYTINNIHSVVVNATIVSQYINQNSPIFDEIENQYIEIYSDHITELLDIPFLDADKEIIKSKLDGKESLKGTMKNYLNKKVNISDYEFKGIIEMKSGRNKEEKVDAFISKVLIESRDLFCQRLREVLKNDHDFIRSHFRNKIDLIEKAMNSSLNDLQNAETFASQGESIKKEEILKSSVIMAQCEYVINKV